MAALILLVFWAAGLAIYDWRWRRLPNGWLLAGVLIGLIGKFVGGIVPYGTSFAEGSGAAALAMVMLWPLYKMRWMGAGDVKFCAVIGWLGGIKVMLAVFLIGSIAGGALGLLLLTPSLSGWLSASGIESRLKRRIPFGSALAVTLIGWTAALRAGVVSIG